MNKKQITTSLFLILILTFSAYSIYSNPQLTGNTIGTQGEMQTIQLTKQNLPLYLNQHEIVKNLPKSATIGFQFYNIQNGQKIWQELYYLENKKVEQKDFTQYNPDIVIVMHSKYFPMFGDICNAIKTANQNGDLQYSIQISKSTLLWRYKRMLKYKKCF